MPKFCRKTPADCYSVKSVQMLAGASYDQLNKWSLAGLLPPSIADARGAGYWRLYSETDVLKACVLVALTRRGIHRVALKSAMAALGDLETINHDSYLLVSDSGAAVLPAGQVLAGLQGAHGAFIVHLGKLAGELRERLAA